jgi:dTDP-4-amino-4,6-dideoxygalactose transaminase
VIVPFVDLKAQYRAQKDAYRAAIDGVLESTEYILGTQVREFESAFARYLGTSHALGVANGTDAIVVALRALALPSNAEIIVPVNTYYASAAAIVQAGFKPVFVDVDAKTYLLDLAAAAEAVTPRTAAIMIVHLYGRVANMDAVLALAKKHGLKVIEDAAQAHGAKWNGKRAGSFGDVATFSFYPSKNLGAFGDGGAIATNSEALAEKIRCLRDHGQIRKYEHVALGWNSRLDTIHAAVLNVKLPLLDGWNQARAQCALSYETRFQDVPFVRTPELGGEGEHVFHLYVVRVPHRDRVFQRLAKKGVMCGIHYPKPLHRLPVFADLGYREGDFPVSERLSQEILSLPMFPELTSVQLEHVVRELVDEVHVERPTEITV